MCPIFAVAWAVLMHQASWKCRGWFDPNMKNKQMGYPVVCIERTTRLKTENICICARERNTCLLTRSPLSYPSKEHRPLSIDKISTIYLMIIITFFKSLLSLRRKHRNFYWLYYLGGFSFSLRKLKKKYCQYYTSA